MRHVNLLLIFFTFLSGYTITSEERVVEAIESSEADSKVAHLKLGYEYLLDEHYEEALYSFETSLNLLDPQVSSPSVEFLIHFGLIIAYDNLNLVVERNIAMNKLSNCIHDLNQINPQLPSQSASHSEEEKTEILLLFQALASKSSSEEVSEFFLIILQDIENDIIKAQALCMGLQSKEYFWNKKGWFIRFLKEFIETAKTVYEFLKVLNEIKHEIDQLTGESQ